MKYDLVTTTDDIELSHEQLEERINDLPQFINERSEILIQLERKIDEANDLAYSAKEKAETMKTYEPKKPKSILGKFVNRVKNLGKDKEIIEGTQDVVKEMAEAQMNNAQALALSLKFNKEIAKTSEYLFYLGCYNIASNEAMIANLNKILNGNSEYSKLLSEDVKEQYRKVVTRLIEQQDVLHRQEESEKKIGKMVNDIMDCQNRLTLLENQYSKFIQEYQQKHDEIYGIVKNVCDSNLLLQKHLKVQIWIIFAVGLVALGLSILDLFI